MTNSNYIHKEQLTIDFLNESFGKYEYTSSQLNARFENFNKQYWSNRVNYRNFLPFSQISHNEKNFDRINQRTKSTFGQTPKEENMSPHFRDRAESMSAKSSPSMPEPVSQSLGLLNIIQNYILDLGICRVDEQANPRMVLKLVLSMARMNKLLILCADLAAAWWEYSFSIGRMPQILVLGTLILFHWSWYNPTFILNDAQQSKLNEAQKEKDNTSYFDMFAQQICILNIIANLFMLNFLASCAQFQISMIEIYIFQVTAKFKSFLVIVGYIFIQFMLLWISWKNMIAYSVYLILALTFSLRYIYRQLEQSVQILNANMYFECINKSNCHCQVYSFSGENEEMELHLQSCNDVAKKLKDWLDKHHQTVVNNPLGTDIQSLLKLIANDNKSLSSPNAFQIRNLLLFNDSLTRHSKQEINSKLTDTYSKLATNNNGELENTQKVFDAQYKLEESSNICEMDRIKAFLFDYHEAYSFNENHNQKHQIKRHADKIRDSNFQKNELYKSWFPQMNQVYRKIESAPEEEPSKTMCRLKICGISSQQSQEHPFKKLMLSFQTTEAEVEKRNIQDSMLLHAHTLAKNAFLCHIKMNMCKDELHVMNFHKRNQNQLALMIGAILQIQNIHLLQDNKFASLSDIVIQFQKCIIQDVKQQRSQYYIRIRQVDKMFTKNLFLIGICSLAHEYSRQFHIRFLGDFPEMINVDSIKQIMAIRFLMKFQIDNDKKNICLGKDYALLVSIKDQKKDKYKFSILIPSSTDNNNQYWLVFRFLNYISEFHNYDSNTQYGLDFSNDISEHEQKNFSFLYHILNIKFFKIQFNINTLESKIIQNGLDYLRSYDKDPDQEMFIEMRFEKDQEDIYDSSVKPNDNILNNFVFSNLEKDSKVYQLYN